MTEPIDHLLRRTLRDRAGTPPPTACLDGETVAAMIEGTLTAPERADAAAHLADCERCQAVFAALARTTPVPERRAWWRRPAIAWLAPLTAVAAGIVIWVNVFRNAPLPADSVRVGDAAVVAPPEAKPAPQVAVAEPPPTPQRSTPPPVDASPRVKKQERYSARLGDEAFATHPPAAESPAPAPPAASKDASVQSTAETAAAAAEPMAQALAGRVDALRRVAGAASAALAPETITVRSGALALRALVWRPAGDGPFPAVLFNHGSYSASDGMPPDDPATLGRIFARHGYVFLFLFRQGVGLSHDQGIADGEQMARAFAAGGQAARNRVQIELLEGEQLNEVLAGLAALRARPEVDAQRIAVAGHSFGGSLSLLLAAREPALKAVVSFGGAAGSWPGSPSLRARLLAAARDIAAPVFFVHAANDYSVAPGEALAGEMQRLRKPHRLEIYPPFGGTPREGHNLVFQSPATWEHDVFAFLDAHVKR